MTDVLSFYHSREAKFLFNFVHSQFNCFWVSDIQLRQQPIYKQPWQCDIDCFVTNNIWVIQPNNQTWTGRTVPPVAALISEAADSSTGNLRLAIATCIHFSEWQHLLIATCIFSFFFWYFKSVRKEWEANLGTQAGKLHRHAFAQSSSSPSH